MGTRRLVGASMAVAIGSSLYLAATVPMAGAQSECEVEVEPATAPAGAEFTLRGSGFTATRLTLQKGDSQPVTIDLDLGDDDPFEVPISSNTGDEGEWMATAASDSCSAEATFTVTLLNTDTVADVLRTVSSTSLPAAVALGVIVAGFAAGALLGRLQPRA